MKEPTDSRGQQRNGTPAQSFVARFLAVAVGAVVAGLIVVSAMALPALVLAWAARTFGFAAVAVGLLLTAAGCWAMAKAAARLERAAVGLIAAALLIGLAEPLPYPLMLALLAVVFVGNVALDLPTVVAQSRAAAAARERGEKAPVKAPRSLGASFRYGAQGAVIPLVIALVVLHSQGLV